MRSALRPLPVSLALVCFLAVTGCPSTILAEDYDQACDVDADCITVFSGDKCGGPCTCANDAIAASARQQYTRDFSAIDCFDPFGPEALCDCLAAVALCDQGLCTAVLGP
jgi:hypothetical protein